MSQPKCPQCQKEMQIEHVKELNDDISRLCCGEEAFFITKCCNQKIKGISRMGMYFIISEPPREGEEEEMLGAR